MGLDVWPRKHGTQALGFVAILRLRFKHQIKPRLSGPAKASEPAGGDDFSDARLACLCPQCRAMVSERRGNADHGRGGIEHAADRREVLFDSIAGKRLDNHPFAILVETLADVPRRPDWIAHVVQTIEMRDEGVARARVIR